MNRRGFLQGILAAGVAPAICRVTSLMPIIVPEQEIIVPEWWMPKTAGEVYTDFVEMHLRQIAVVTNIPYERLIGTPQL